MTRKKKPEPTPRTVFCFPKYDLTITSQSENSSQASTVLIKSSNEKYELEKMAEMLAEFLPTTAYASVFRGMDESAWNAPIKMRGSLESSQKTITLTGPPGVEGECRHVMAELVSVGVFRCRECGEVLGPEYEVQE